MQTGQNLYDGWVNDSDLIGTHWRYQQVRNLTDFMANEGKDVTNPGLDLDDFIGSKFTTAPDKKLYQLPDQQFANLYWFRYDWFNDEKNKADFKAKYGYDLGVPVNWSAYEDIAEFFTGRDVDGKRSTAIWTMARRTRLSAGALPMRGFPWLATVTRDCQTVCRSMNGVSRLMISRVRSAHA